VTPTETMSLADYRRTVVEKMTEKEWEAQVEQFAKHRGWLCYHTHRSDHSAAGFPDLVLVRALPGGDRRVIFAELKTMKGKVSPAQREWLAGLGFVADLSKGHVEVHCWRPCHWDQVRERLM
jgi:hypothetical protein